MLSIRNGCGITKSRPKERRSDSRLSHRVAIVTKAELLFDSTNRDNTCRDYWRDPTFVTEFVTQPGPIA
jgi:hypothetical protein